MVPENLRTPATSRERGDPILLVEDLQVLYRGRSVTTAVDDISFSLHPGRSLAIMGESGSGKSSVGQALMGLLRMPKASTSGKVVLDGEDLNRLDSRRLEDIRGEKIAMVFQDPLSSLNPVKRIGDQIAELYVRHRGSSAREAASAAIEVMERVHIPDPSRRYQDYPHQFSGGMRQRVMIAMAIALSPRVLIADEPTTALDVTVQAQIVELLAEVREQTDMALILISHDLGLAAALADDLLVMYAGRLAEYGPLKDAFAEPAHPYTRGLLNSAPATSIPGSRLAGIEGTLPRLDRLPVACAFHPRCPMAELVCEQERPLPRRVGPDRSAACHFADRLVPPVSA